MKKATSLIISIIFIFTLFLNGCSNNNVTQLANLDNLGLKKPAIVCTEQYFKMNRNQFTDLSPNESELMTNGWDLRSFNLKSFNLSNYSQFLKYVTYDTNTLWPGELPLGFSPTQIMDLGRDPGLQIRSLQRSGITGKGVNIAIVDQALLLEHQEYKDNIMLYERLNCLDLKATMHGSGVASIAVGKSVGVAPEAKLYYIASTFGKETNNSFQEDLTWMAEGIKRVLEINKHLSDTEKIRVISISTGFDSNVKGSDDVFEAIKLATQSGVFVITPTTFKNYGFTLMGLDRDLMSDPNDLKCFTPGIFWSNSYYSGKIPSNNLLLVPMDARTYASFTGINDYAFSSVGGLSWTCPWLAGLYALCVQVNPKITIDKFIHLAFETGDEITIKHGIKQYTLKTIINPKKLVNSIKLSN